MAMRARYGWVVVCLGAASAGLGGCSRSHSVARFGVAAQDAGSKLVPDSGEGDARVLPDPGGPPIQVGVTAKDDAERVFDPEQVRSYELQVDPADLARIDAMPSSEEYIPATLSFDGEHYGRIGMRYKGSA